MSASEFDPVPASGLGSESFDQPALFFLTHQQSIEQWAELRSAAAEAAQQWINTTIRESLTALAAEFGMELSAVAGPHHWQHLLLHPPETPTVAGHPVIGLGLCWHGQKLNPKSHRPFVGIRVESSPLGTAAGAAFLDAGGAQLRTDERLHGKGEPTWPAYFFIPPAADRWWVDLDAYRSLVLSQTRRGLALLEVPMRTSISVVRAHFANSAQPGGALSEESD